MKKVVSVVLIIAVATLLVFSLCACNKGDKIVGKWNFSNFDFSYGDKSFGTDFDFDSKFITFNSDGTLTNGYQNAVWLYDSKTKEYTISDTFEDDDLEYAEKAFIDKDGILHIDIYTYKKA